MFMKTARLLQDYICSQTVTTIGIFTDAASVMRRKIWLVHLRFGERTLATAPLQVLSAINETDMPLESKADLLEACLTGGAMTVDRVETLLPLKGTGAAAGNPAGVTDKVKEAARLNFGGHLLLVCMWVRLL
jgi:hypothetical protein